MTQMNRPIKPNDRIETTRIIDDLFAGQRRRGVQRIPRQFVGHGHTSHAGGDGRLDAG